MRKMIYGPVPSRRLGISLGVDIIPFKTCSYDCIYCQLGRTTDQTLERRSYVTISSLINQLKEVLELNEDINYITFSGSGEPTLNQDIGEMIRKVKELTHIPVAVLTNGSLLWDERVRKDLSNADLVVPSLDAVSEEVFHRVNRPASGLSIEKILGGLESFTQNFKGKIYLEVMLVNGINDSEEEITKINQFLRCLRADKVALNTVVRPPGEPGARALNNQELVRIKSLFDPETKVELIPDFRKESSRPYHRDLEKAIVELLRRRPARREEMASSLGVHLNEIVKSLQILEEKKIIRRSQTKDKYGDYFVTAKWKE